MKWLSGKRTYLVAILSATLGLLWTIDVSIHDDPKTPTIKETGWPIPYVALAATLGGGGIAALRAGIAKGR